MQLFSLSPLYIIFFLTVVLFALLTQRMIVNQNKEGIDIESEKLPSRWNKRFSRNSSDAVGLLENVARAWNSVKTPSSSKSSNSTVQTSIVSSASVNNHSTFTSQGDKSYNALKKEGKQSSSGKKKKKKAEDHEYSDKINSNTTKNNMVLEMKQVASNRTKSNKKHKKNPAKEIKEMTPHQSMTRSENNDKGEKSPRNGTNINSENQLAILKCSNQSRCIVPQLALKTTLKIYFCKHPVKFGIRFYFLVREGLILHPNVDLVEDIDAADFIIYLPGSAPWHKTECANDSYRDRLIVLDEFDGHSIFLPYKTLEEAIVVYGPDLNWYFMYFKRSFVSRKDGKFIYYPHLSKSDVYPLTYAIAEAYIPQTSFQFQREIEILCTLRGSKKMTTRLRVQEWVAEYATNRSVPNVISGQVNAASRAIVSKSYFQQMYNAKIIVTVNPANWEGDFRLWESFATGALVIVDPLFVPHPYPLIDGVNVVYFNNQDKNELWEKLDYYRANPDEARKIAIKGYLHAMKFHRTVNMVDYILRSAHLKLSIQKMQEYINYEYSGQYLKNLTKSQDKMIRKLNRPGNYLERQYID